MFTCSADGKMYPPMVVFPYKKIPFEVTRSVPADWGIGKTDSGWMTTSCFLKYVRNVLHPQLVEEDALPAVYYIDGHSSHTAWETAEECRKLGIHLICLYPNCTRILQPLDVAVFKPLKSAWIRVVDEWKLANPNKYLKTDNFSALLAKAMEAVDANVIKKGFECCGLFPFDENNVDYTKCLGRNRSMSQPEEHIEATDAANDVRQLPIPEDDHPNITDGTTGATIVETFAVIRSEAEEILHLMGPERRERYRTRDTNDFGSLDELILARVFKLLEPLDSMSLHQQQIDTSLQVTDRVIDNAEPMEIIAEYLIDQPEKEYEYHYILETNPEAPEDETAMITENLSSSKLDYGQTRDDVQEPKDDSQQRCSLLSEFLESPETPHRKGNIRYKRKSPAVLTSRRRLMYHKAVEKEKKKEAEEKQKKAEEKQKKAEEKQKKAEEKQKKAEEKEKKTKERKNN